jgi:CheY-like chemotaxis protein
MDILVADDDSSGRFLLNSTLVELGHSVTEAANGFDAWEAWKRGHHQLVISDWMMPGIDGLEFCRKIRAEEASGFAYIILTTARAGKANYLDAIDSGVDDFLHKPFDRDRFIARVRVATRILDLHHSFASPIPTSSVGSKSALLNWKRRFRRKVNFFPAPVTSYAPQ